MGVAEDNLPMIAVTSGDPAGIGPEVVLKALNDPETTRQARWIVVADATVLRATEALVGSILPKSPEVQVRSLNLLQPSEFTVGEVSPACGRTAIEYVKVATRLCLAGEADAMVTAPLNKEAVSLAGERFPGHTEFIAELCGVSDARMLLVNDRLSVVHVSTHIALRQACRLDFDQVLRTIHLGRDAMVWRGVKSPRIAVCGLNPHAGEKGLFGDEDEKFITPAVKAARTDGLDCDGPLPADTVFLKALRGQYDLVVAMYHDQGHIPMKLVDFEHTVNVTLGLPIIRTSVDHGTAFDIAGKNLADPTSMKAAMRLAVSMAYHRRREGRRADD